MSTKDIDDALFAAFLRGDEESVGTLLNLLGAIAIRTVQTRRFRRGDHCMAGESAEDVVSDAKLKFLKMFLGAARSDTLKQEVSFASYFIRIVDNTFNDLYRRERRRPVRDAVPRDDEDATETDGEQGATPAYPSRPRRSAHVIDEVADPSPTPEEALVARQTAQEVAQNESEQLSAIYRRWCEWPGRLLPYCDGTASCPVAPGRRCGPSRGRRPALVSVLQQMTAYLRSRLLSCQVSATDCAGNTLLELLETADVRRLAASLSELNTLILPTLSISRTTLDQRWADLKEIGRKHGIPHPPGLFTTRHRS